MNLIGDHYNNPNAIERPDQPILLELADCIDIAWRALDGKVRLSSGRPAYHHSYEAAVFSQSLNSNYSTELLQVLLLHDVIEDSRDNEDSITILSLMKMRDDDKIKISQNVIDAVNLLTHNPDERTYLGDYILGRIVAEKNKSVRTLAIYGKIFDLYHNLVIEPMPAEEMTKSRRKIKRALQIAGIRILLSDQVIESVIKDDNINNIFLTQIKRGVLAIPEQPVPLSNALKLDRSYFNISRSVNPS